MNANKGDIWNYIDASLNETKFLFVELLKKSNNKEELWAVLNLDKGIEEKIYWWPKPRFYKKVA